jgi:protein-disulfide isomerase|tara:strand:+ start:228 stop:899 length:672 start_codon:yes stop_codon:yes gene_type:complete
LSNTKKYVVAGVGVMIVVALAISFTSYLGQFEQTTTLSSPSSDEMVTVQSPVLGSESASVTIVEVGDYQCEMCKHWFDNTRQQVIDNYIDSGKVNMIFIDMPFLGTDSHVASMASYCAADQEKYWEYHVMLYEHQEGIDSGWASNERLKSFAFTLDLDMNEFSQCLDSKKYYYQVKLNLDKSMNSFGIQSTPTFLLINTSGEQQQIRGAQSYSVFERVIESLL